MYKIIFSKEKELLVDFKGNLRALKAFASKKATKEQLIEVYWNQTGACFREAGVWWDAFGFCEANIIANEVERRLIEEDEGLSEDDIYNDVCNSDFLQDEWEYFKEMLAERLAAINKTDYVLVEADNVGWRHESGSRALNLYNTEKGYLHSNLEKLNYLLSKITPNSDFSIKAYCNKTEMRFIISHHDSMGDFFSIKSISERTFNQLEG